MVAIRSGDALTQPSENNIFFATTNLYICMRNIIRDESPYVNPNRVKHLSYWGPIGEKENVGVG